MIKIHYDLHLEFAGPIFRDKRDGCTRSAREVFMDVLQWGIMHCPVWLKSPMWCLKCIWVNWSAMSKRLFKPHCLSQLLVSTIRVLWSFGTLFTGCRSENSHWLCNAWPWPWQRLQGGAVFCQLSRWHPTPSNHHCNVLAKIWQWHTDGVMFLTAEWVLVDLACHAYNMVTVPLWACTFSLPWPCWRIWLH